MPIRALRRPVWVGFTRYVPDFVEYKALNEFVRIVITSSTRYQYYLEICKMKNKFKIIMREGLFFFLFRYSKTSI